MESNNDDLQAELNALLAEGQKIKAIQRYREATGADLAAAKEAVETLERGASPADKPLDAGPAAEIVALLEAGRKLEAVKLYRERTGVDLKQARDAVEAIAADRRIVVPSGSGCLGVVLLMVAILLASTL